ncbi:MAG: flagellar assembly protein FliW [Terriglobia bacterium]|nr:MAG: flagellar assembly protein FliW [Terriglobia bacterium]
MDIELHENSGQMSRIESLYFNELEYNEDSPFYFAAGIPGFEEHTAFLFVEQPHTSPLIFMQSLRDTAVCFVGLPAAAIDPDYRLQLSPEEGVALGLPWSENPEIGQEIFCLALITIVEGSDPVANLMSPIVVNLKNRKGIQAIQLGSHYSLRHPLAPEHEAASCS